MQLVIDSEVLAAVYRTQEEINVLRTRHAAMMSSLDEMTSLYKLPSTGPHPLPRGPYKPQLQVRVVKGR